MEKRSYKKLEYSAQDLVFGVAKYPITRNGVTIGGKHVVPEMNFTLPPMMITKETLPEVRAQYREMLTGICQRAVELFQKQLVVEFELLPPMTMNPEWGADVTRVIKEVISSFDAKYGLKTLIRATIVDLREQHSTGKRSGADLEKVLQSFRLCAQAGADMLAIESIGGKEVTDKAVTEADIQGYLFGSLLACQDMKFLWNEISKIADETGTISSGDTACGFGNTAMVLADRNYIPKVFATVVRSITAVRSLVAYEEGAIGPGKDCGYENPYLKAITGFPMSMEGRSSACAHLSALGNIAGAYADLWSNESVQNIKLLSGMAPIVSMEQLAYDCRLFNVAADEGRALQLRDWFVKTDASLDPQAYIFTPENVIKIAQAVINGSDYYSRILSAAKTTVEIIHKAHQEKKVLIPEKEVKWIDLISDSLDSLPKGSDQFVSENKPLWQDVANFKEYNL